MEVSVQKQMFALTRGATRLDEKKEIPTDVSRARNRLPFVLVDLTRK
jgi:hypothetical protein